MLFRFLQCSLIVQENYLECNTSVLSSSCKLCTKPVKSICHFYNSNVIIVITTKLKLNRSYYVLNEARGTQTLYYKVLSLSHSSHSCNLSHSTHPARQVNAQCCHCSCHYGDTTEDFDLEGHTSAQDWRGTMVGRD